MAFTTLKIMFRFLFLSIFNWKFIHIPVLWCLWTRSVFLAEWNFPPPLPQEVTSVLVNKKAVLSGLVKATYWEIIQCYTHSIFLVPFQCSVEEIHGNVLVLIKPLNDKWLEPPKKEMSSIIELLNHSWMYFLTFGSFHLSLGLLYKNNSAQGFLVFSEL